jgi:hypothetical protein
MGSGAEGDLLLEETDSHIEEQLPLTGELLETLVEEIEPEIVAIKDLVPEDMQ